MLSSKFRSSANLIIIPLAKIFAFLRVPPIVLTLAGLVSAILCFWFFYTQNPWIAFVFMVLTGFFDAIDGAVARLLKKASKLGAFTDSVIDRYADGAVIIGVSYYLGEYFVGMLALLGSLMVSYTRARAEHFIPKCDVGIGERAERLLLLILAFPVAALTSIDIKLALHYALILLVLLAFSTALERFFFTYFYMRRLE